jgi:ferredoxin-NADP reductase/predicted pyridoxine 5'-phosphate oxidase superfamily flavin-nucleotide-binding protein
MATASVFHEGERRIHARLGIGEQIEPWAARVVRPFLPGEHREFYATLPFVVAAARDAQGRPWATVLAGEPGFVSSPDPSSLGIAALPPHGDALANALLDEDEVGLLGIELHTRRRNRVNGHVVARSDRAITLSVDQSFGNCPQYITERHWHRGQPLTSGAQVVRGDSLGQAQRKLIRRADTFFIASGFRGSGDSPVFGMDASHRGGPAGFVQVRSARRLVFPDYAGNNHFNTLGNLEMDPRAGLLFVDFECGSLLQLSGCTRVDWDSAEIERFPGARRLVHFEVEAMVSRPGALGLRWQRAGTPVRELRVIDKRRESADVTSFVLASRDGRALAPFAAGQYLPVQLEIPGRGGAVLRTWSLSGSPDDEHYRISVKREPFGVASRYLHDEVAVGSCLAAAGPQGDFVLDDSAARAVVLVSAGVGLTPLVSMAHELAGRDFGQPVWFVHGARDGAHHPLREEVGALVAAMRDAHLHVAYSRPRPEDRAGSDYHSAGRIDAGLLENLLGHLDADFYLCGPPGFLADMHTGLEARGVPEERIRSESFAATA